MADLCVKVFDLSSAITYMKKAITYFFIQKFFIFFKTESC